MKKLLHLVKPGIYKSVNPYPKIWFSMKNHTNVFSILTIILLLLLSPSAARADVAPPPIPIVGGVGHFEYQNTNVQMVSERVEMELTSYERIDVEYPQFTAIRPGVIVDAWFIMRNTSNQDETMQVVFPLNDMNECPVEGSLSGFLSYSYFYLEPTTFKVQVNGEFVETKTITTEHPWKEKGLYKSVDIQMDWAAFDVNFPANEDTLIRVSYILDGNGDSVTNVGYTLETGAGWKGPIGEAIIVFRFPYVVDNFIMPGTTPGYQTMQNEIYWRYEDFEPTHNDNISVAFISPGTWANIRESRSRISNNPKDDAAWVQLANSYSNIAHWHGPNIRSKDYSQRAYKALKDGLKENPTSGLLNASYVDLYLFDCCYYEPISEADFKVIQPYIEKAVWYPSDNDSLWTVELLKNEYPDIQVRIGPTHTPTATSTPTATAKVLSPTRTWSPRASRTPTITRSPTKVPTHTVLVPSQTASLIQVTVIQGDQVTVQEKQESVWKFGMAFIGVSGGLAILLMWRLMKRKS